MLRSDYKIENISNIIQRLHEECKDLNDGRLACYIPELAKADPKKFGIAVTTVDGQTTFIGDAECLFTLQSISKPLIFGLALETHGLDEVRYRVDVEPTGEPFDSIIRLGDKSKRPFNPLVNTGAIAMTNMIPGKDQNERQALLQKTLENYTGRDLTVDHSVFESEKATGHRNRAIAHLMLHFGMMDAPIEDTMDLYFRQCSFNVSATDLAMIGATLANKGVQPLTKVRAIDERSIQHVLALMFTCGLYTYAGEWAFDVGIPAKSGVSGAIMAVVPGLMGIGIYSPLIDHHGNSVRAVKVFEALSSELKLHSFGPHYFT